MHAVNVHQLKHVAAVQQTTSRREMAQHVLQDAAVLEVVELVERIDAADQRIVTVSLPLRPNVCQDVPSSNTSGITPIPIRLERWIRSNDCVITARMPS